MVSKLFIIFFASESAIYTGTPNSAKNRAIVDLPLPIPPVSPIILVLLFNFFTINLLFYLIAIFRSFTYYSFKMLLKPRNIYMYIVCYEIRRSEEHTSE